MTNRTKLLALVWVLGAGCRTPHVDLQLALSCTQGTTSPLPTDCHAISLGCVDFIEANVFEWKDGKVGDLPLLSNCMPIGQLGSPKDLCALEQSPGVIDLFSALPQGKTVRFELAALQIGNLSDGCNIGFNPTKDVVVFDGFSEAIQIDGTDRHIMMPVATCGSCGGAVASVTTTCTPPAKATSCGCQVDSTCELMPGDACDNGTKAELIQSGCCAVCPSTGS